MSPYRLVAVIAENIILQNKPVASELLGCLGLFGKETLLLHNILLLLPDIDRQGRNEKIMSWHKLVGYDNTHCKKDSIAHLAAGEVGIEANVVRC